MLCRMRFQSEGSSMQRSPHQKCSPSARSIMAKKRPFAVCSALFTWCFGSGRQLEIEFLLMGRTWGECFVVCFGFPPPLFHALVWAL